MYFCPSNYFEHMIKTINILIAMLLLATSATAQTAKIWGSVADKNGPIASATVSIAALMSASLGLQLTKTRVAKTATAINTLVNFIFNDFLI